MNREPRAVRRGRIGPDVQFATKPELAVTKLTRALDAEVPVGWVAGDVVDGQHAGLRLALEERGMAYVLAVPVNRNASLTDLVGVAGRRWKIEESFETSKGEVGLDHYQGRRYDAWYRHITLAC